MRALLSLLLLTPCVSAAAVAPGLDVDELTARAQSVVQGRVVALRTVERRGMLFTEAEIEVSDCLKGRCDQRRITVLTPGGAREGVREVVPGAARFEAQERVFLFLRAVGDSYIPTGMAQGKFRVFATPGPSLAIRDLHAITLAGPQADGARRQVGIRLDRLIERVRAPATPSP